MFDLGPRLFPRAGLKKFFLLQLIFYTKQAFSNIMKMKNELDTLVSKEIEAFEHASMLAGFTETYILVFVSDKEGTLQQPIRVTPLEPLEEPFPEKLEIITDILGSVEAALTKEGHIVCCSMYNEHLIGENGELVYVQLKDQHKITHKVFRITRENFYVDSTGRLQMEIKTERFENF